MDTPWKALAPVKQDREYLALLSYLPLRSYSKLPRFFQFTFQIQRQLSACPGAIGYSMRAKLFGCKFWTLSVWESERALMDFVSKVPHGAVMKALAGHMGATKFTQWKIPGSAIPPSGMTPPGASYRRPEQMAEAILKVFRGDKNGGKDVEYKVPIAPGMVVLDALHYIQGYQAPDLAVRWNCKAGKCGSCSAEVNGRPRLTCKTRMDTLPLDQPITVQPMKTFPVIKDLVTDVSWNYKVNKKIPPFQPQGGNGLEVLPGRRRPGAGVPQVHRVLPVPERVPRPARS